MLSSNPRQTPGARNNVRAWLSRQSPHNTFKCHQSHRVGRKSSQETREEATPVAPPTTLLVHCSCRLPPVGKPPRPVPNAAAQWVRHDALLDDIAGITCQPKDLGAQSTGPKVDSGCAEVCRVVQPPAEQIVAAPPKEEEGPEQQGG